jgi:hypothetical protein
MTGLALTLAIFQTRAKNEVKIVVEGDYRIITANGIPDHSTGAFPNQGNPNSIAPQNYRFRVPANPKPANFATDLPHQDFGVALNGVPFDPFTAEFWNGDRRGEWNYEGIINGVGYLGIDFNNAHVQPTGAYHYHANPLGLMRNLKSDGTKMVQIGWAADGFPIYGLYGYTDPDDAKSPVKKLKSSWRLKKGTRPSGPGGVYDGSFTKDWEFVQGSGDLDDCNGRTGVTPEFPKGTYYYVISENYPWIPRKYRGTPDKSFERGRPGPGGPGGPGFGPPPGGPGGPPPGGRRGGPPPDGGQTK